MHRWKYSALAAAVVTTFSLYAADASALALGPITVQSALGEPLRAEIELPQITPAEANSLRASTAPPEVFRSQGLEYSSTVTQMRVQPQRRADGTMVLRLSSDRPINDPFVDLVIDATWGAGRITRSYTMLFDPPTMRRAPAAVTAAPQIAVQPSAPAPAPPPAAEPPPVRAMNATATTTPPVATERLRPAPPAEQPPRQRTAPAAPPVPPPPQNAPSSVTVKQGDTAGRLAGTYRPAGVSLDQMLVALMRANPEAFVQNNVNRLKSGSVLQVPNAAQAQVTPVAEARQIMTAQSRDFNEFRRKLATAAPVVKVAAADRSAKGTVQSRIDDKRPANAAPDKLTLSKGAMKGQKIVEEALAEREQNRQASARVQELSKNIDDLQKIRAASGTQPSPPAAKASDITNKLPAITAPSLTVPAPLPKASGPEAVAPPPITPPTPAPVSVAASEPSSAPVVNGLAAATIAGASDPASATLPQAPQLNPVEVPTPAPTPAPAEEPGFFSGLMDDPVIPLLGGGLLAAVAGAGAYLFIRKRKQKEQEGDSSFLESRMQPDSFFGATGGQQVDTTANADASMGSSTTAFGGSSQLDAGGDVDPVAEADVYLAYGRDLQAEEILKEALRHSPTRIPIHTKLGEIYAKRHDRKALAAVAAEVHELTHGEGPDWSRIVELGREVDPGNPLYQPGGHPVGTTNTPAAVADAAGGFASTFAAAAAAAGAGADKAPLLPPDMDLDLRQEMDLELDPEPEPELDSEPEMKFDLDLGRNPTPDKAPVGAFAAAVAAPTPPVTPAAPENKDLSWDIPDLPLITPVVEQPVAPAPAPVVDPVMADLDFSFEMDTPEPPAAPVPTPAPAPAATPAPAPAADPGLMDFDLGDFSFDAEDSSAKPAATPTPAPEPESESEPAVSDTLQFESSSSDPLDTKLALAQEFHAIGDSDGARSLIEEVIAESSGDVKARAQRLLAELD
ncbi:MAG: hypothetical protein K2Q11_10745 [Burkholderiaceae bacterium]|nr:hypothetical protein [Burkholderiaceae bacterium]